MSAIVYMTLNEKPVVNQALTLDQIIENLVKPKTEFADFNDFNKHRRQVRKDYLNAQIRQFSDDFIKFHHPKILTEIPIQNPTNLTNSYWQWLVRHDISAYYLELVFESKATQPLWSMGRMGQSSTLLPDGREILIGGEFEDGYDPMFWIYNDVIVKHPNGDIEIFGYPRHIFAPTDFHTATLVGDDIWIIGSLGLSEDINHTQTSVYKLNIHTYKIEKVETRNSMGWVHDHSATLKDNQIIIKGGKALGNGIPAHENIDDWSLNLKTLIWKNLTNKKWNAFLVQRKDGDWLYIDDYKELVSLQRPSDKAKADEIMQKIQTETNQSPALDLYAQLFVPPIDHEIDESEQDFRTYTIFVEGIKVRYVFDWTFIQVYVEGKLSTEKLELLQENLRHKLSRLENHPCEIKNIFV